LDAATSDTIKQVKEQLRERTGATTNQQQLVFGSQVLKDGSTLKHYGMAPPQAIVQLVVINRASSISRYLEGLCAMATTPPCPLLVDAEHQRMDAMEASLFDVVDSVLQSEHSLSQRSQPCPSDFSRPGCGAPAPRRRAELIAWMMQAFEILSFDDALLHSVVLTLDRYYAKSLAPMDDTLLHRVLLSAVCTEMKTASAEEFPIGQWQTLLTHLCQGRVSLQAILRTELEVLSRLGFVVGIPTPLCFLRGLSIRLREEAEAPKWLSLASFLLELAVFDTDLEYSYPHVVLAAAALGCSLRVLTPGTQHYKDLLEDVTAYCVDFEARISEDILLTCQEELLTLWLQCAAGVHEWSGFSRALQAKLIRRMGGTAQQLSPAEALKSLHEARCMGKRVSTGEAAKEQDEDLPMKGLQPGHSRSQHPQKASSTIEHTLQGQTTCAC
jgi:hypothetical protein